MLPFHCSTCDKKLHKDCIIPDTETLLRYTVGAPGGIGLGVDLFEKDTDTGKVMRMAPFNTYSFQVPDHGVTLTSGSRTTGFSPILPVTTSNIKAPTPGVKLPSGGETTDSTEIVNDDSFNIQISSIDYNNTPDGADGSFVIMGTISCANESYNMSLTATWAFEKTPPALPITTAEEKKSGS